MKKIKKSIESLIYKGLIDEAYSIIDQYKKAIGIDEEIASMEAITYIYKEKYENAIESIQEGFKYNIKSSDLYYSLGNIFEMREEYNKAYLTYENALFYCNNEENRNDINQNIDKIKNYVQVNKVSIVILTYNQLEYTKRCIKSILETCPKTSYELVVVDNNSQDGTVEWLKEQSYIDKIIYNTENKGFPAGCNIGIKNSEEKNDILLLNNDTELMVNSLFNLRMGLYSSEEVGSTGSVCNSDGYYQQVLANIKSIDESVSYSSLNNIYNNKRYEERIKLVGFAMLIKREVINKIGGLDERFTPGTYEDDDLSIRIRELGYELLLCHDSYIHHYGGISFGKIKNYSEIVENNRRKFFQKWHFTVKDFNINIGYDSVIKVKEPKRIIEINCKCGANLIKLKNIYKDSHIEGINCNDKQGINCNNIITVEDYEEFLSKSREEYERYDLVLYTGAKSKQEIKKAEELIRKNLLRKDGQFIIQVDNPNSILSIEKNKDVAVNNIDYIYELNKERIHCIFLVDYSNKERYLKELEQKYKIEKNTLLLNEVYYSNYTINEDTDSQTNIFFSGERFVKSKLVESQYNDVYNEHIERYKLASNFVKDKIVIDAACGTGYGSEMLAKSGAEVVMGFDISKEAVLSSKQNYSSVKNLSFQVGDVTKLSLSDKSADVFISFETIEHIKCGIDLIRESSRLLKENGLFIVSTPNRNVTNPGKYFNEAPMNPYHQYEYNVFQFMGDLLENYDIIDVYGQSMYFNNEIAINKLLRKCCNLSEYNYNELNLIDDYKCYKINEFKDIQPTYITMICRKK